MEKKMKIWITIFLPIILPALLFAGCAKIKGIVAPSPEGKKEDVAAPPEKPQPEAIVKEPIKEAAAKEPVAPSPPPPPSPAPPPVVQQETQPKQEAAPPAPETTQDPIASGSLLLNPDSAQDAKIIQTRLSELGLYKGAIDGLWGRGSKAALKSFKEKNSLDNPDQWDKETQMFLFRGTGK